MEISCAFPPVPETPSHIALAESLGYRRAWIYDTPALQLDVWMILAVAAERTERIELGPGVLIPSLRHVLATASAIATLESLARGRVNVGIGSGFTGRYAMGQRANKWSFVEEYARKLKALLSGDTVEVEGAPVRMLHGPGQAPSRPIDLPFIFGTGGPRGEAVARKLGDGIITVVPRGGFRRSALLTFGTVLEAGETYDSPRVLEAAGPGAAVRLHGAWERGFATGHSNLDSLPGGTTWRETIESLPESARHLSTHEGHLTFLNEVDKQAITGELVRTATLTGDATTICNRIAELEQRGVTDIAFQPAGRDIPRELRSFASVTAELRD